MKDTKKIIISIIGVLIIIIIMIAVLLMTLNKNNSYSSKEKGEIDSEQKEYLNNLNNPASLVNGKKPELVKMENVYFNAKNCIDKYFSYIKEKNPEAIISVLDAEYIKENKIDTSNIMNKKFIIASEQDFIIEDMYSLAGSNYTIFYIKGIINENEKYIITNIDFKNETFSIEPIGEEEYKEKIDTVVDGQSGKEKEIEKNEYNLLNKSTLKEEDIANKYFLDFKDKMITNVNVAYNMLDNEYKIKRFYDISSFKAYIKENIKNIKNMMLTKYSKEEKDGYTQLILVDNYDNNYIFKVTSAMKYTVLLDNYTVETDEFKEKYNNLSESDKINTNIDKFIRCINNKDYNSAYSYLDKGFKNNYFTTINDFQEYVKNNFYNYNILGNVSIKNEGRTFICTVPIKSGISVSASSKTITMFMQLKEGTDFVMSFSIE